jgi:hypothetical protein
MVLPPRFLIHFDAVPLAQPCHKPGCRSENIYIGEGYGDRQSVIGVSIELHYERIRLFGIGRGEAC